jgi:hypothetical protein
MRKDDNITSILMLFTISAVIIGVSAAAIPLQRANAVSNDDDGGGTTSSCRQYHHPSNNSKKCSKNDTPLILPFP